MKKSIAIAWAALAAASAFADPRADEVARGYFAVEKPRDTRAVASMVIVDRSGASKTRKLEMSSRQTSTGRDSFVRFLEPADVAGTKLLTLSAKEGGSDQRLYLPALKKARKISSSGKDGNFVNSDLSFYDMEDREFGDFDYSFISEGEAAPDEALSGLRFYKIEMRPKDAAAPYARIVGWIDMDSRLLRRSECYDRKDGALIKTILFAKVVSIEGIYVTTETVVANVRTRGSTRLKVSDIKVNGGLGDDVFSLKNLER
jgi:hypothetical protein